MITVTVAGNPETTVARRDRENASVDVEFTLVGKGYGDAPILDIFCNSTASIHLVSPLTKERTFPDRSNSGSGMGGKAVSRQ